MFWNLKRHDNSALILKALTEHNVDIAVFAEHSGVDWKAVAKKSGYQFEPGLGGCNKIVLLHRTIWTISVKQEQNRYILYEISSTESSNHFVLCATHLQDRFTTDTVKRIMTIGRMINDLQNAEETCKTKESIIIGDLNSNPYDPELLGTNAFNAVLFKDVINAQEYISFEQKRFRRLYNPIIHYISEDTKMYGSIYNTNSSNSPIWHCFDQILVTKPLINSIQNLAYLKEIGSTTLMAQRKPKESISDHLPLLVTFSEEDR